MSRAVVAIMALALLGFVAVFGFQAALAGAGDETSIDAESWSPNAGAVTELAHSNLPETYYSETVTVQDSNGNAMDAGTDYEWFDGNGTVKALTGGGLDGETDATISYSYQQPTDGQQTIAHTLSIIPNWIGALLPLLGVLALLMVLRS